ncbi:uncharacterized protein [Miscanthus floridulus]|uniref:uncharacterized protein isoform X2 n=1 Tax=Miscanthus floridulus TaxID=154761 RepID=UPI0034581347
MPSQPPPGSTGGSPRIQASGSTGRSPRIPAELSAQAVRRVVDFFKINEKLRPVTAAAVSSPFLPRGAATPPLAGMPSQPAPDSTGGSPRTPAPGSTGGIPRIPELSAQAVHRIARKCTTLVDWCLERVEGEEGKIRVAGTTFTPQMSEQMRKGASSSKGNMKVAGRVFRSSAIVKRHAYLTIESEDGYQIQIGGPLNIPKTRENGFSEEVCESFGIGFPILWQRLVNPKMVPDNEHARSSSETTTGPPSPSVEDYMAYFLSDSFSSKITYDFDLTENDFYSSVGYSGNTDGLTTQSPSNLPDDNAGNITASLGLYGLRMGVPEKPLAPPGEACNSGQESYQHESTQIDASKPEIVNRSISSVSVRQSTGSISSNSKVDGNILAPSKISSVVNEGYRSTVGCGQADEDADIQQENMHSCSSEHGMVAPPLDCTFSQLGEPGIPKSGKDSVNIGTTDALELPTEGMTPKFGAIRGLEDSTGRRLRSGKVLEMPCVGPMKRGRKQNKIQQESSSKQMVNQGATSNADLTSHENDFSAAEVVVEEKLESHDSCRKGRGRTAEGKRKRKRE